MIKKSSSNLEKVGDWIQKNVTDFNDYFKDADIDGLKVSKRAINNPVPLSYVSLFVISLLLPLLFCVYV